MGEHHENQLNRCSEEKQDDQGQYGNVNSDREKEINVAKASIVTSKLKGMNEVLSN